MKVVSINDTPHLTAADIVANDNRIRTVGPESAELLGAITADAFRNDPFNNWFFDDFQTMQDVFILLAREVYAPNGFCQILSEDGEDHAAALWTLPGDNGELSMLGNLQMYWSLFSSGGFAALKRGQAVDGAMAAHLPREPHAYLFLVGVMGRARGRGLGRQLIEPILEACDRTGTMAYLENSNPANTRVYESLGFRHVSMIEVVPGCPKLEAMKRTPKAF